MQNDTRTLGSRKPLSNAEFSLKDTVVPHNDKRSRSDPLFSGFLPRKALSLGPSFIFDTEMADPSPASTLSHAHRTVSDAVESRVSHENENNNDDYWSDEDGEEDGPKRKRARPLST